LDKLFLFMVVEVEVDVGGEIMPVVEVVHILYQKRIILVVRQHFPWMLRCGLTIPAFLNSSRRTRVQRGATTKFVC
jgi:hypothetical protein